MSAILQSRMGGLAGGETVDGAPDVAAGRVESSASDARTNGREQTGQVIDCPAFFLGTRSRRRQEGQRKVRGIVFHTSHFRPWSWS
jgi:hypothetical protein